MSFQEDPEGLDEQLFRTNPNTPSKNDSFDNMELAAINKAASQSIVVETQPMEIAPQKLTVELRVDAGDGKHSSSTLSSPSKKAQDSVFLWEHFLTKECGLPEEDVEALVQALQKEKYTKEDISMINNDDLKEMGFPGGHRKKFLAAGRNYSQQHKLPSGLMTARSPGVSPWKSPRSRRNSRTLQDQGFMHTHQFNEEAAYDVMRVGQPFVQYYFSDQGTSIHHQEVNVHYSDTDGGILYWGRRSDFRTEITEGNYFKLNDLLEVRLGPAERMMFRRAFKVEQEHVTNCVAFLTAENTFYFEAPNIFVLNCYLIGISSAITGISPRAQP